MTSGSLPGPSPRVGKSTNNGPKTRQKGSKTVPRALNTTFHLPLSHPERPPEADLAPKRPQDASGRPFGTPGGERNSTPGRSKNVDGSSPREPISHASGATLCLDISRHSPPLRPPLSPLHPHVTSAETASQEGPAECAKRLNNIVVYTLLGINQFPYSGALFIHRISFCF
mgnify:CR=1 FL=1